MQPDENNVPPKSVTVSQKGHGVSFADFDNDGDLDLFVELGGATPGDQGPAKN